MGWLRLVIRYGELRRVRPGEGVCVDWIPGCHGSVASVDFVTVQAWEMRWRTQEGGMLLNQTLFSLPGQKGMMGKVYSALLSLHPGHSGLV